MGERKCRDGSACHHWCGKSLLCYRLDLMKHASVDRAKRVSSSCRNHGSCPWCKRSRTMQTRRVAAAGGAAMRIEAMTQADWRNDYRARSGHGG